MALSNIIDQDIKQAMLAKDNTRLRGLRAIKAALLLAKTEKSASETLSEEAEIQVLQKLVKQRKESASIYEAQGRNDLYQVEMEEIETIETYLPAQMDRAEIEDNIRTLIAETGANSIKDMGKVMGLASKRLAGRADGQTIAEVVKSLLA